MEIKDKFIKYVSIINHDKLTSLKRFIEYNPEFVNEEFSIQEKIDGSNIQIKMHPDGDFIIGTREGYLGDRKFHNLQKIIEEEYQDILIWLKHLAQERNELIILFGEIFGPNLNKRINYGDSKRVIFFDMMVGRNMLSPKEFYEIMIDKKLSIIQLKITKNLQEALDLDVSKEKSVYSPSGDIIEGIVIKPYNKIYLDGHYKPFFIKKRNESFLETKPKKPKKEYIKTRENPILPYLTENRLISVFSKVGEISSNKEIGKYIKLLRDDSIKEYELENEKLVLDHVEKKQMSKTILKLLNKYL